MRSLARAALLPIALVICHLSLVKFLTFDFLFTYSQKLVWKNLDNYETIDFLQKYCGCGRMPALQVNV